MTLFKSFAVNNLKNSLLILCSIPRRNRYFHQQFNFDNFTDVTVNIPFNIVIKPIVHPDCNKIISRLQGFNGENRKITANQIGDVIEIKTTSEEQFFPSKLCCELEVPVKANLKVFSQANIEIGYFHNSFLILKTNGNVTVEKYQGKELNLSSRRGNIEVGDVLAGDMRVAVTQKGSIKVKKIQAKDCDICAQIGDINISASYCDNTKLSTKTGNMKLGNMHREISVEMGTGNLIMTGVDGNINAEIQKGNADIHISRIRENGLINLKEGNLNLKLSEDVQDNTRIEVVANSHYLESNTDSKLKYTSIQNNDVLYLEPVSLVPEDLKKLFILCNGKISVRSASWMDLILAQQQIKT